MEAFASAYYSDAPGPFTHPDGAYVLAFSIIMLNTDRRSAQAHTHSHDFRHSGILGSNHAHGRSSLCADPR